MAILYVVATPIGNLQDLSPRAADTLRNADLIIAEDTRVTMKLCQVFDLKAKLVSCHRHNEDSKAAGLAGKILEEDLTAALVTDAGTPCISDPGERLVRACIETGTPFEVLPGASASLTAAIMSGLGTKRIFFVGFLPRENRERAETIAQIRRVSAVTVLYESPYRMGATLKELAELLGDRKAAVVREITKLHEETVRGTLLSLAECFSEEAPRGECVIVISGEAEREEPAETLDGLLTRLLAEGMSVKDAAKRAAMLLDVPKSEAYKRANELKE